jgi:hypothetical protein
MGTGKDSSDKYHKSVGKIRKKETSWMAPGTPGLAGKKLIFSWQGNNIELGDEVRHNRLAGLRSRADDF